MDKQIKTWEDVYATMLADKKVELSIMYHDAEYGKLPRLNKFYYGDWIDLYTAEEAQLLEGDFRIISLGISVVLPKGYEAIIAPRSSTFKKYGIIQANSLGIIDNTYCGEHDIWGFPAYATRHVFVPKGTRLCQFRILKNQPQIDFNEVPHLEYQSRGGFGSTGE